MEKRQPIDYLWAIRLVMAAKRLVTMATWQSFDFADDIEAMVDAFNKTTLTMQPLPPTTRPVVKRQGKRRLRYELAVLGEDLVGLIRPNFAHLHWRQNPNYSDPEFLNNYAYCELIGPDGHAASTSVRFGLLLLDRHTHYPPHAHPASEVYFVLSGHARFRQRDKPWRSCPIGQFVFHESNVPHEMQTRDDPALLVYWWRGDVTPHARLTD
jgi:mannose-6-phosphate isomerase-like protein (cupin superfamily)